MNTPFIITAPVKAAGYGLGAVLLYMLASQLLPQTVGCNPGPASSNYVELDACIDLQYTKRCSRESSIVSKCIGQASRVNRTQSAGRHSCPVSP
jgi:hypothetical protein